jgi:hypothetical protein
MTCELAPDFVTDRKLVKITDRLSLEFLAVDSEGSCADTAIQRNLSQLRGVLREEFDKESLHRFPIRVSRACSLTYDSELFGGNRIQMCVEGSCEASLDSAYDKINPLSFICLMVELTSCS